MKKVIFYSVTIIISLLFTSCLKKDDKKDLAETKKYEKLENAKWIIGSWGNTTKEGVLSETWSQLNDSTLSGKTAFITGKDTLFTETIEIIQINDSLLYNTKVSNQNEGRTVSFKASTLTENQIVFENSKHDFPQKITYNKISSDSLVAKISGKKDGKEASEEYPMRKNKH
ncbi:MULTISPECIES: DUF6265 family protein [Flavobacterium]|uniref:DUF6265 domain-containing protein n=1 Tax=Flavobacterium hankyongi TaxID=1176532 RepID=A0ABP8ZVH6_9FLAO|nr:DUF6265 family protein [Flavobacterium sp. N1846]